MFTTLDGLTLSRVNQVFSFYFLEMSFSRFVSSCDVFGHGTKFSTKVPSHDGFFIQTLDFPSFFSLKVVQCILFYFLLFVRSSFLKEKIDRGRTFRVAPLKKK